MSILPQLLGRTGFTVSRLGLGTVEIGLPYGLGVDTLPSEAEAERILKTAVDLGITYIDTARGYGVAEERIGRSGITQHPNVVIGTKCAQFLKQEPKLSGAELERRIRDEIDTSRRNLRQEQLQLVQLHIESSEYLGFDEVIEIMQKLKDEGKVAHVGIATRGDDVPLAALKTGFFETIQAAYSILDQRMAAKVLPAAHENGVGTINRSVLLKGALTPARAHLPASLARLKERAEQAAAIADELGITLPALALRFVISQPAVTTALLGTVTPEHLITAVAAIEAGPLSAEVLEQLHALAIDDPEQVDPARWPKL